MIPRTGPRCAALALVVVATPRTATGYDAEVRAETYAQAYQVRGPFGAPVISSRRVSQALSLAVVEPPADPRGVTVSLRLRLRLDADFGEACDAVTDRCLDETNRERPGEFEPLFARRTIDLPFAYLDVSRLARGALDVRAGRIFQVDPLGFFVFDGARARLHLGGLAVAEALAGLETRAGFPLANGRFERDGLIRADRAGWDPALAPYVVHRQMAPVVGFALETAGSEPVHARASWRRVWTDAGIAEDKLGAAVEARLGERVLLYGDGVFSVPERQLTTATLGGEWQPTRGTRGGLELSRYRPSFDLNSIWASFWADGTDDLRAYASVALSPRVTLSGSWTVRRYALSESGAGAGGEGVDDSWNTGGMASLVATTPAWQGALRARAEGGAVGARAGIDGDAAWWALPQQLRLDARVSLWHADDELRPERAGLSFGGVVGATVRMGAVADLHLDLEDDVNRVVGHRFRLAAILALRGPF
jgi:hypothetical protein